MNLVVGATGLLGREICSRLRSRGARVRGLVRAGSVVEADLASRGVDIARGDLKDVASLAAACRGVQAVVSTATCIGSRRHGDTLERVDREGQLALVRAARDQGVGRFLFVSVGPGLSVRTPFVRYKREVEVAVRESGMTWTILQPTAFMEVWFSPLTGWDLRASRARIIGSGLSRTSVISLRDVAKFVVCALESSHANNRSLPLGGPTAVTPLEVVRYFEEATGRRFRVQRVPAVALWLVSLLLRPFHPPLSSLLGMASEGTKGEVIEMDASLADFDVTLTPIHEFVARAVAEARAGPDPFGG